MGWVELSPPPISTSAAVGVILMLLSDLYALACVVVARAERPAYVQSVICLASLSPLYPVLCRWVMRGGRGVLGHWVGMGCGEMEIGVEMELMERGYM